MEKKIDTSLTKNIPPHELTKDSKGEQQERFA